MKTWADLGIDLGGRGGVDIYTICPKCSPGRSKSKSKCLHVNTEKQVYYCNHCAWAGGLEHGERQGEKKSKDVKVEYVPPTVIEPILSEWFAKRGIGEDVLRRNKIDIGMIFMPQVEKEVLTIQFPFIENGNVVNVKMRAVEGKHFRQIAGAKKVLYGLDDIQGESCVIVEGEIDKLSLEVAGITSAVSVPDGAPAVGAKVMAHKFEYLQDCSRLESVNRFVLAVDNDGPGKLLEEELARRLGPDRCVRVTWPEGCKDANDVLLQHGPDRLRECIGLARPYPLDGVMSVADVAGDVMALYQNGLQPGMSTGWASVDKFFTVKPGEMTVVTGIPSHGKSEWLDALSVNLALEYGMVFGVCSPENMPLPRHLSKLLEKHSGKPFRQGFDGRMTPWDLAHSLEWLNHHFHFIVPDEAITIDTLLQKSAQLVHRVGIKALIIDPWNEFDHRRPNNISETEYISQSLGTIRRFGRNRGVHVFIVAHPAKMQKDKDTKQYPVPTPYDISGSAHWRNKPDNCITIHRTVDEEGGKTSICIQKVRFREVGHPGVANLQWNPVNGRYEDDAA